VGREAFADTEDVRIDAVLLTALPEEEAAVLRVLRSARVYRWRGRTLWVADVGGWVVLLFPLGAMGNVGSAEAAARVIGIWNPALLVVVGIAGGARKAVGGGLRLGDVLLPDQVVGYESGRVDAGGSSRRYEVYRSDGELIAVARSLRPEEWAAGISAPRPDGDLAFPRVHFGPVFSGEKVLADGATIDRLRVDWPRALGVEMEGLGGALACYHGGPAFLMVRAVSDFADASKDDDWHAYAAEAAARLAVAVLERSPPVVRPVGQRPQAVAINAPQRFPGPVKLQVCQRLLDDWRYLADYFGVPAHKQAGFRQGDEARQVWHYIEARGKLYELPAALEAIDRGDLADLLPRSGHIPGHQGT
jgi:nucleoside phosphorylase